MVRVKAFSLFMSKLSPTEGVNSGVSALEHGQHVMVKIRVQSDT